MTKMAVTKVAFGVVFVAVAALAIVGGDDLDLSTAWLWVVALGGIGVAGLVASVDGLVRWRRTRVRPGASRPTTERSS